MEDNYNPIYGGVSFKEFEAACRKKVEYLNGLAGTVQIRDMVKDEIRENLRKDMALADIIDIATDGARRRFVEAMKVLSKDMTRKETSETPAKTETL